MWKEKQKQKQLVYQNILEWKDNPQIERGNWQYMLSDKRHIWKKQQENGQNTLNRNLHKRKSEWPMNTWKGAQINHQRNAN